MAELTIELNDSQEEFVNKLIQDGQYASLDEIVADAIEMLAMEQGVLLETHPS